MNFVRHCLCYNLIMTPVCIPLNIIRLNYYYLNDTKKSIFLLTLEVFFGHQKRCFEKEHDSQ